MDSSFILSLAACLYGSLYICTLFLNIQYRGDFGLIGDGNENEKKNNENIFLKNKNNFYDNKKEINTFFEKNSNIFEIFIGDLNLLFSSLSISNGIYGYGNKMNNLDLKDV